MIASTFLFAVMNVCIKQISHIPAIEVILFRSLISLVMSGVVLLRQNVPLLGNNRKVLLLRGLFGGIALVMYFTTLQKMPLASAQALQYLSPVFTALFGIIIVKEKLSPLQVLFLMLSLSGVFLIQGFDVRVSPLYAFFGVVAAAFAGLAYNCIRKLNTTEHPLVIIFYFPLVCLPIAAIWSYMDWVQPQGWDWFMLICVGVLTQMAQYFMTKAYQTESLARVAPLNYLGILYALSFGFLFFDEFFNLLSMAGMALVLLGVLLNMKFKPKVQQKELKKA
ncbi:DMT family transporter [Cytophagales bacterium RKSG123]|nr:DMT family transporter [Xanthovirga aplysinae]